MLLLVGLGNPGPKDINNRHNIGFRIIDSVRFALKSSPADCGVAYAGELCCDLFTIFISILITII